MKAEMPSPTGFTMNDKDFEKYEKRMAAKEKRRKNRICFCVLTIAAVITIYAILCGLACIDTPIPDALTTVGNEALRAQAIAQFRKDHPSTNFTLSLTAHYGLAIITLMMGVIAHAIYFWNEEEL